MILMDLGNVIFERKTELKLVNPPLIRLDPERQTVWPGSDPTVTCMASGAQPIHIYWSKASGEPLPSRVSQRNGILQVIILFRKEIFCI